VQGTVGERSVETKTRVFISYSRKDMTFADRLEAALKARGVEVLIDRQEIYAFEDWWKRIQALIGQSDTVVFVLSPDAVESKVALREIAYAASLDKRFAPIVCRRVENAAVPDALRRLNFIFFDDREQFEASADRLTEALQTDIGWIRQHTQYGEEERRWSAAARPSGLLLRSPTLEVAEHWVISRPREAPEPSTEVKTFIAASRKGARAALRFRHIVTASMFTLLVFVILGLVGWINQSYFVEKWRWFTMTRDYEASRVRPYVLTAAQERALKPGDSFKECARDCSQMIVLPPGSFTMGSPETEKGRSANETPRHVVTIAKPFAVAKFELTFADWNACLVGGGCDLYLPNTRGWGMGRQPVINVSWNDARRYVAWLSQVTGKSYRLLSEAEYEYAARASTTTAYPWGDDIKLNGTPMANCSICGSEWDFQQTAPAGSFSPNKLGLYDMVGNVREWTEDCLHNGGYNGAPIDGSAWIDGGDCTQHILRGGSWYDRPVDIRSASRDHSWEAATFQYVGLRIARTLVAP
jgi:formylglycine-generating enzyme required for sulfatase activity